MLFSINFAMSSIIIQSVRLIYRITLVSAWFICYSPMSSWSQSDQNFSVIGHAHNDYLHDRPLFDALELGFASIEVDIHYHKGELRVAHNRWGIRNKPTIQSLYLEPLDILYQAGYFQHLTEPITIMIDLKTKKKKALLKLSELVLSYNHLFRTKSEDLFSNDQPFIMLISGDPPISTWMKIRSPYFYLDARIGKSYPQYMKNLIKRISAPLSQFISHSDLLNPSSKEYIKLKLLSKTLLELGYEEIRFWDVPNDPRYWQALIDLGINTISVDQIELFSELEVRN